MSRLTRLGAVVLSGALLLAGCSSGDPLASPTAKTETIVVGSQDYYSSEIIAEIYAQALEKSGRSVDRQLRIGQREVYIPEIVAGKIDLFPEYTGPLLQAWKSEVKPPLTAEDAYSQLKAATPTGLRVLDQSPATDQDSYVVTQDFATKWSVASIADLAKVTGPLVLGANSEAQSRPNGPNGILLNYGVKVGFTPIEDGGGPLTIKALTDGQIQLAIMYTANPAITANKLVSLKDPKGMLMPSHVVPLASSRVDDAAAAVINKVSAAMSAADLLALNARSVNDQLPASTIASDWLKQKNIS